MAICHFGIRLLLWFSFFVEAEVYCIAIMCYGDALNEWFYWKKTKNKIKEQIQKSIDKTRQKTKEEKQNLLMERRRDRVFMNSNHLLQRMRYQP